MIKKTQIIYLIFFSLVLGFSFLSGAQASVKNSQAVPGQIIVKLKAGKTTEVLRKLNAKYQVTSFSPVFKPMSTPQENLTRLKNKLTRLGLEHQSWYWQLDKESPEYKDYLAKLEAEKSRLQKEIKNQEEVLRRLEERNKMAPAGLTVPTLDNIYLLKASAGTDTSVMAIDYAQDESVEYAEPNYIARAQGIAAKSTGHNAWYWQLNKDSSEYRAYIAKLTQEKIKSQNQDTLREPLIKQVEQKSLTPEAVVPLIQDTRTILEPSIDNPAPVIPQLAEPVNLPEGSWGQNYADMWWLERIKAKQAWEYSEKSGLSAAVSRGSGVVVAVVDSGIDYNHPDIWDNIWVNPDVVSDTYPVGKPDGKINLDDCDLNHDHIIQESEIKDEMFGYDFIGAGGDFVGEDNNPMDLLGHGTHVAGIIAASGKHNSLGVIGVAPEAKIMNLRGLDKYGSGNIASLIKCIIYAADKGADIINNSWGAQERSLAVEDAMNYAYAKGCIILAAAGNDGLDVQDYCPASIPNVITVSALDYNNFKSYFSNYGNSLKVAAPGGSANWELIVDARSSGGGYAKAKVKKNPVFTIGLYAPQKFIVYLNYGPQGAKIHYEEHAVNVNTNKMDPVILSQGTIDTHNSEIVYHFPYAISLTPQEKSCLIFTPVAGQDPQGEFSLDGVQINDTYFEESQILGSLDDQYRSGADILSLRASNTDMYRDGKCIVGEKYYRASGTSMACPMVSGVAALALARNKAFKNDQQIEELKKNHEIEKLLKASCDDLGFSGWDICSGYGLIDASNAVTIPPVCTARFDNLYSGSVVTNDFKVIGSAEWEGDSSFTLSYRRQSYPPLDWQEIKRSGVSVTKGVLADLDTSGWLDGELYDLQLSVTDKYNNKFKDNIFVIPIDSRVKNNFPIEIPSILSPPLLADIDGDDQQEIVVMAYGLNSIYVIRSDGSIQPGWPKKISDICGENYVCKYWSSFVLVNLDPDKSTDMEIVFPVENLTNKMEYLVALHYDGSKVSGKWPVAASKTEDANPKISADDLNGDGKPEVVVLDAIYANTLYVFDGQGNCLPGWPVNIPYDPGLEGNPVASNYHEGGGSLAIGDIDGDGHKEIVAATMYEIYVYRFDGTLLNNEVYKWPQLVGERPDYQQMKARSDYFDCISEIVLGDVNKDGKLEVFAIKGKPSAEHYVYAFTAKGAPLTNAKWFARIDSFGFGYNWDLTLADVNNDGYLAIFASVFGQGFGETFAWDYQGQPLAGWTQSRISAGKHAGADGSAIADIDGDGKKEVMIYSRQEAKITAWDAQGQPLAEIPSLLGISNFQDYLASFQSKRTPAIGDIDNDGHTEIIGAFGNTHSFDRTGRIFAWKMPGRSKPEGLDWPMYRHDCQGTANYNFKSTVFIHPPSNLTAAAASSSVINLSWQDNSDNEEAFGVEESQDGINFKQVSFVRANNTTAGCPVRSNTKYYYRVQAINSRGNSPYSNIASAVTPLSSALPLVPQSLDAVTLSANQIQLRWMLNTTNKDGIKIERSHDNKVFTEVKTVFATGQYIDSGLQPSTQYYYRVRAFNSAGNSGYSAVSSAATFSDKLDTTPPTKPVVIDTGVYTTSKTGLGASFSSTDTESVITEYQYQIIQDRMNGLVIRDWCPVDGKVSTIVVAVPLVVGRTYYFAVKAKNSAGLWSKIGFSDGIKVIAQ